MAREVSQARRHANRQAWLQTQIRCRELGGGACHDSQSEGSVHRPAGREDHRGELAGAWLDAKRTRVKPSYMDDLEDSWRVWVKPAWGDVPIGMVTRNDVQKWVTDIAPQRSASVTLRAYGILAGILDNAVRDGMIHANHARGVELPRKKTKRHVYLTAPQLYSLAGECGWRRDIILTLGLCGMRWGELVPLRVRDVDLDRHRIMVDVSAPMVGGKVTPGTPRPTRDVASCTRPSSTGSCTTAARAQTGRPALRGSRPSGRVSQGVRRGVQRRRMARVRAPARRHQRALDPA